MYLLFHFCICYFRICICYFLFVFVICYFLFVFVISYVYMSTKHQPFSIFLFAFILSYLWLFFFLPISLSYLHFSCRKNVKMLIFPCFTLDRFCNEIRRCGRERCCVISPESRLRDWPKMEHLQTRRFYGNNFGSKLQTNCSLILFGCTSFGGI